jgi:HEAT repeat protein
MTPDLEILAQQLESPNSRDRLIALAGLRDVEPEAALPLIKKVLQDDNLQIRSMAVFALGLKRTAESFDLLLQVLTTDPDYGVRASAVGALGYLEDERALEPLLRAFYEETDWLVRFSAAVALGNLKAPKAEQALLAALDSGEPLLEQAAIAALGEIGAVTAVEKILNFAAAEDWLTRLRLAEALGNLPSPKTQSALAYLVWDSHPQVAEAAQLSLTKIKGMLV